MSLDGIIAGLQIHGIGCEKTNFGYKIGFVIPQDINVAVKNKQDFDRYVVKYQEMQSILDDLAYAGATITQIPISKRVTIYGGIPACGAWACYEIDFQNSNGRNVNSTSSLFRRIDKLIPAVF